MHRLGLLFVLVVTLSGRLAAQVPTGTIAGTVTDQVGAVLPQAAVTVTNRDTGAARVLQTAGDGTFSVREHSRFVHSDVFSRAWATM